jgi:menaquinone-9 beta-reductase
MGEAADVFVIGGGPAGLAAAIAARRRGLNVIVADGAQPPIDKACGEGLMPDAITALRNLGIAFSHDEGFPFRGIRFLGQTGEEVAANFPSEQGMGLRRLLLHEKMIAHAERMGVTLLWKTCVTGVTHDGVVIGGHRTISARWIVGADGMRSRVRRWAGLNPIPARHSRYAFRSHYAVRPWTDCMEVYWAADAQAYVTPVSNDEICMVLMSRSPGVRAACIAEKFPLLAERLSGAAMGAERGELTVTRSLQRVYRGRLALIGDASGTVDAITGEGLCLSFLQAEALAAAFESGDLVAYQAAHRRIARRPALMSKLLLLMDAREALRRRGLRTLAAYPDIFRRLLAVHTGNATSPAHLAAAGALLGWRLVTA